MGTLIPVPGPKPRSSAVWISRARSRSDGLLGGALIAGLELIEYRFLVVEHSIEIDGGIVALLFATLGIWLGLELTRTKETVVVREVRTRAGAREQDVR